MKPKQSRGGRIRGWDNRPLCSADVIAGGLEHRPYSRPPNFPRLVRAGSMDVKPSDWRMSSVRVLKVEGRAEVVSWWAAERPGLNLWKCGVEAEQHTASDAEALDQNDHSTPAHMTVMFVCLNSRSRGLDPNAKCLRRGGKVTTCQQMYMQVSKRKSLADSCRGGKRKREDSDSALHA